MSAVAADKSDLAEHTFSRTRLAAGMNRRLFSFKGWKPAMNTVREVLRTVQTKVGQPGIPKPRWLQHVAGPRVDNGNNAAVAAVGKPEYAALWRAAIAIRQTAAQRPGAVPAIGDLKDCAPKTEDYPPAAARNNQQGTTRVSFTVDEKGQLQAFGVTRSSGHLLLDYTALIKLLGASSCRERRLTELL